MFIFTLHLLFLSTYGNQLSLSTHEKKQLAKLKSQKGNLKHRIQENAHGNLFSQNQISSCDYGVGQTGGSAYGPRKKQKN